MKDSLKQALSAFNELGLRQYVKQIILGGAFSALLAVLIVLQIPKEYEAHATLAAREKGSFDVGVLASQFSGLGAIAGLDIGGQSYEIRPELALEYLGSRKFVSNVLDKYDLLPIFFAAKAWDIEAHRLVIDPKIYDSKSKKWVRKVRPPKTEKPHIDEVLKKYSRVFQARLDKKSGLVTLRYRHRSPEFASKWLNLLVNELNETLRRERIAKLEKSSSFLEAEIAKTPFKEIRTSLNSLLQEQKKLAMVAAVTDEFAFEVIDPAVAPYRHAYPPRAIFSIMLFAILVALECAVFVALAMWKRI